MAELVDWLVTFLVLSLLASSQAKVEDKYKLNDTCTNECNGTEPYYWCGRKTEDANGFIKKCVQYTSKGDPCVSNCKDEDSKTYKWCLTNVVMNVNNWDYCSLEGFTINKVKCVDECTKREDGYYWCHTSITNKEEEDYCSPSGRVKTLQMTSSGEQCITECAKYGEDYTWCRRNQNFAGKHPDNSWGYCTLDEMHTSTGKKCKEKCSMAGERYYWCYTEDGSWGYCSPTAKDGVHISLEPQLDIRGRECRELCDQYGQDYYWCKPVEAYELGANWWMYCSPTENVTIYNEACSDGCKRRGEGYFWCHTQSSWDYCSPNIYSGASVIGSQFTTIMAIVIWYIHSTLDFSE